MYKLGIKRRFWFGYKWHTVAGCDTEVIGASARLIMTMADGVKIAVPNIHNRQLCIYPEYRAPNHSEV